MAVKLVGVWVSNLVVQRAGKMAALTVSTKELNWVDWKVDLRVASLGAGLAESMDDC